MEAKTFQVGGRHEQAHGRGKCQAGHCECVIGAQGPRVGLWFGDTKGLGSKYVVRSRSRSNF